MQLEQASKIKQLQQQLAASEAELERINATLDRSAGERAKNEAELSACRDRVTKLRSELSVIGLDSGEYEHAQQSLRVTAMNGCDE